MLRRLILEIHRRSLWQVLAIFIATGWAVLQAIDVLINRGILPEWVFQTGFALLLIGLPVVMATAFVQEGAASRASDETSDVGARGATDGERRASAAAPAPRHRRLLTWRHAIAGGVGAFALLGFASAGYMGMRTLGIGAPGTLVAQGLIERGAGVVVADFEASDDAELGDVVTRALVMDLVQSPAIRVLDRGQLREPLRRMQSTDEARMTAAVATELAEREGYAAVISGEVAEVGTGYVLTASVFGGEGFVRLAGFRESARSDADLVDAVERLSRSIRDKIGESLRTVRSSPSLQQVTTSSLPALRAYTRGFSADSDGDLRAALAEYERAVELDSTFAMAHRKIAATLNNLGIRSADRRRAARRAWELSERLPELERHLATGYYHDHISGDADAAVRAYEAAFRIDSADYAVRNSLANWYLGAGRLREAEELYAAPLRRQPMAPLYFNLATTRLQLGEYDRAVATVDSAMAAIPDWNRGIHLKAAMAAATYRFAAADSLLDAFEQRVRTPFERMLARRARMYLAALHGRVREAERISHAPGAELADPVTVVVDQADLMLTRGDTAGAVRTVREVLASATDPEAVSFGDLLWIATEAGDLGLAAELMAAWDKGVPRGERGAAGRIFTEMHTARIARLKGDYDQAAAGFNALLQLCWTCGWAVYDDLGHTLSAMGDAPGAIAAFERSLAHHYLGRSANPRMLARALRRLAELHDATGDVQKAVEYYARFIDLWKDADPELQPQVRAAQQRLAQLVPGSDVRR